jgi:hypothetical protein
LDSHEDPSPHVYLYSFGKTNISHACVLVEQPVKLDVKTAMCFTVVKRKDNQLKYMLLQMSKTTKMPRVGTSPLVVVPLWFDLLPEQVKKILR